MGDIELQIFSDRIKELRTSLGLTQSQFVEGLDITASALSAYEKNTKNPSISVAKRIAEKYNISIDWLCGLSQKKERSLKIITYADLFQMLSKICETDSKNGGWEIDWIADDPFIENNHGVSILRNYDPEVCCFFKDWNEILKLYKKHTIDKHLYELWLSDKIKYYNDKLINSTTEE